MTLAQTLTSGSQQIVPQVVIAFYLALAQPRDRCYNTEYAQRHLSTRLCHVQCRSRSPDLHYSSPRLVDMVGGFLGRLPRSWLRNVSFGRSCRCSGILKEILFTTFYSPDVAITFVKCDYDWMVGK